MCGMWRTSSTGRAYIYYRCPHDPANPRHAAAYPDHGTVALSETAIMAAIATFFDQYVFGHDRAALLAEQLPATTAEHAQARAPARRPPAAELARIDTAERALISELEQPADPADPATQAYRARIRARFTDLYAERTRTEASPGRPPGSSTPRQRPGPARPAPRRRRPVHRRPRPDQRSPADRVRHPGPLPARPGPGHHLGQPHRRHPPHHRRPARRPPHRQRHRPSHPSPGHVFPFSTRPYGNRNGPRSWASPVAAWISIGGRPARSADSGLTSRSSAGCPAR